MIIWIITATYQGVNEGVQLATLDEEKAQGEYRRLVRDAMGFGDRDNPWEDVEEVYETALNNCAKIDEYLLEGIVTT